MEPEEKKDGVLRQRWTSFFWSLFHQVRGMYLPAALDRVTGEAHRLSEDQRQFTMRACKG